MGLGSTGAQRRESVAGIRSAQRDCERNAAPIGQDVPLGARFRPICGAGTCLISALRGLHGSRVHRTPFPIDDRFAVVVLKHGLHNPLKDAARGPLAEAAVTRRARTELRR